MNFEKYKYEEDIILLGKEKAEKLEMDFFDFDFLNYQDSLLFALCIYEFFIDFNNYFFNFFNYDFFSRTLIFKEKKKKKRFRFIKLYYIYIF